MSLFSTDMTFGGGSEGDGYFTCVVRDETTVDFQSSKHTTKCAPSATVKSFYEEIAALASYKNGTFLLIWDKPNGDIEELDPDSVENLQELGLVGGKNSFRLSQRDGCDPVKVAVEWATNENETESSALETKESHYGTSSSGYGGVSVSVTPPSNKYVGLVNQAMTCYLNSLLQTLFMTPEFRNALYRWHFDGTREEGGRSIPFQLQRLFANLQTTTKKAVETTDVTKSFGWTSSDAWQQHDVQELCRVMFDALEKKFKGTGQDDLIKQLYEGKMQDYVKCLECQHESARTDTYLDIPLVIKPFGSDKACKSVEEALESFVKPETLDGSNQYHCEKCSKKVDAHKGLKFLNFPYLLTLQLKRFDFDYTTLNRIKLNDRVTFPKLLDLSHLVATEGAPCEVVRQQSMCELVTGTPPSTESAATPPGLDNTGGSCSRDHDMAVGAAAAEAAAAVANVGAVLASSSSAASDYSSGNSLSPGEPDSGIDSSSNGADQEEDSSKGDASGADAAAAAADNPYLYELFSIMVHSGSAVGGHYYAYIRSFEDGKWYSFNDTSVTSITDTDIENTYGSGAKSTYSYSSIYTSSANAYMLMYRQVNSEQNTLPLSSEDLPEHVRAIVDRMSEEEEEERRRLELERSMWKTKVYYHDPATDKIEDRPFSINKNTTLRNAVKEAHRLWELEGIVPVERCRLVKFDHFSDIPERSYEGLDDVAVCKLTNNSFAYCDLLLETREENEEFEVYKSSANGCVLKITMIDVSTNTVTKRRSARVELGWTVHELKEFLAKKFRCRAEKMRVLMDRYYSAPQYLSDDAVTLKALGFYCSHKIYVAPAREGTGDDADADLPYESSQLHEVLDSYLHSLTLQLTLPSEEAIAPYREESEVADESKGAEPCASGNQDVKDGPSTADAAYSSSHTVAKETTVEPVILKVDKRLTVADVKQKIADLMKVQPESFKVHRIHGSGQEFEVTRLTETLVHYADITRLRIAMGRALRAGEYRVKVFLFDLRPPEILEVPEASESDTSAEANAGNDAAAAAAVSKPSPIVGTMPSSPSLSVHLCDSIVAKGMSIAQLKKNILAESGSTLPKHIPRDPAMIRMRKKSFKSPSTVLLDTMKFEDDIYVYSNWEIFLQPLPDPETVKSSLETVVFLRRWFPSSYSMGPWEEAVLADKEVGTLKTAIAARTSIPIEEVVYARARGSFPSETSLLEMPEQEWNPNVKLLSQYPVHLSDDDGVFFYYDGREKTLDLSDEKRRAIQKQESARIGRASSNQWGSLYKEKALKIYTSVDEEGKSP